MNSSRLVSLFLRRRGRGLRPGGRGVAWRRRSGGPYLMMVCRPLTCGVLSNTLSV